MRDRLAEVRFEEVGVDTVVAAVSGEIDGSNAGEVQRAVAEHVPTTARSLVIDLSQTSYIDSTGVELLFELARRLSSRRQARSWSRTGRACAGCWSSATSPAWGRWWPRATTR